MTFRYSTANPDCPAAYSRLEAMHTECEILLPLCPEAQAREAVERAWEIVKEADRRYNRFNPDSALSKVNAHAYDSPVEVDDEMFLVLELCSTMKKATLGWFDPSANPESRSDTPSVWTLDGPTHSVSFSRRGMSLDLGGFIKGFVLEKVSRELSSLGCGIISFGGSSTYAIGNHPFGGGWKVSVAHPYYPGRVARVFQLTDTSLSVSGKDRHGNGHIIDPTTGNVVEKDGLVAVVGPSPMVTEVLSTALWIAPARQRGRILSSFEGYCAWDILCLSDGKTRNLKIENNLYD